MLYDVNECLETLSENYILWRNGEWDDGLLAMDYDHLAYAYYERGNYPLARSYYDKAIELDRKEASHYAGRGDTYAKEGEYQFAIDDYTKAIRMDNTNATYYSSRADVYDEMGKYDLAVDDYSEAIKLSDDSLFFLFALRGISYGNLGKYNLAVDDLKKAIEMLDIGDLGYAENYNNLAINYYRAARAEQLDGDIYDNVEESLKLFKKSEELGHNNSYFYYLYACALSFIGADNEVEEKIKKSLEIDALWKEECDSLLERINNESEENIHDNTDYEDYHDDNVEDGAEEKPLSLLMDELNDLIGLGTVKNEVNTLINLLRVNKVRAERGMKQVPTSKHLVFSGNPGTGKTTVARILAKIYKALGVLSKGQLIEVDRSKLVAGYVGQTAIQTQEIIQQALGGILFIDEAYTLSSSKGSNDFGQEAIDTILKAMEDNRDDFVVIVAGYPDLMQEFLDSNPGLRSRFNKFINFEDYSPDELTAIFNVLCEKSGYAIDDEIDGYLHDYFEERYNNRDRNFANGREVRNFFEIAVANQANRLATDPDLTDEELITLMIEDVRG